MENMHHMIHHVIIADKKWGLKDLTEENINRVILDLMLLKADISGLYEHAVKEGDDEKGSIFNVRLKYINNLLDIAYRWKDGDFTEADKDHNYIWTLQNGTVGWATGVNLRKVPEWAKEKVK